MSHDSRKGSNEVILIDVSSSWVAAAMWFATPSRPGRVIWSNNSFLFVQEVHF